MAGQQSKYHGWFKKFLLLGKLRTGLLQCLHLCHDRGSCWGRNEETNRTFLCPADAPLLPAMGSRLSPQACPALPCHGCSPIGKAPSWGCNSLGVICSGRTPLLAHGRRVRRGNGFTEIGKNLSIFLKAPKWDQDPSVGPQVGCAGLAQGCQ